jgi:membrane protein DedA with SNARE-associated domain
MIKEIIYSVIGLLISLFFYALWAMGSHGTMRFRRDRLEDWFFVSGILLGFLLIILIWRKYLRKKRNK